MKLLFLGDSITHGFDTQKHLPGYKTINKGLSGYSSGELLGAIKESWFEQQPHSILLCIGTNDLARGHDYTQILQNIKEIVVKTGENISGDTRVCLLSLFPTRHNPSRPNEEIDKLNEHIHALAISLPAQYLHFNPFFKDQNGLLKGAFTDDGLHLNEAAYELWARLIMLCTS